MKKAGLRPILNVQRCVNVIRVYLIYFIEPVLNVTKDPVADKSANTKQDEGERWVEIFVANQIPLTHQ